MTYEKANNAMLPPDMFGSNLRGNEFCKIATGEMVIREYNIYLCTYFADPSQYIHAFQTFREANEHDIINLIISSPGGDVYTLFQFMNAIKATSARVVTHLEGPSCSAGSMLFLCGDDRVVYPESSIMFHHFSTSTYGKAHEVETRLTFTKEFIEERFTPLLKNVLTVAEIKRMYNGEDFYFDATELVTRMKTITNGKRAKVKAPAKKKAKK